VKNAPKTPRHLEVRCGKWKGGEGFRRGGRSPQKATFQKSYMNARAQKQREGHEEPLTSKKRQRTKKKKNTPCPKTSCSIKESERDNVQTSEGQESPQRRRGPFRAREPLPPSANAGGRKKRRQLPRTSRRRKGGKDSLHFSKKTSPQKETKRKRPSKRERATIFQPGRTQHWFERRGKSGTLLQKETPGPRRKASENTTRPKSRGIETESTKFLRKGVVE